MNIFTIQFLQLLLNKKGLNSALAGVCTSYYINSLRLKYEFAAFTVVVRQTFINYMNFTHRLLMQPALENISVIKTSLELHFFFFNFEILLKNIIQKVTQGCLDDRNGIWNIKIQLRGSLNWIEILKDTFVSFDFGRKFCISVFFWNKQKNRKMREIIRVTEFVCVVNS